MSDNGTNTEAITDGKARRLANLRPPWPKGKSANPSGRPKRSLGEIVITRMLKARVPEDPSNRRMIELIARALCAKAIKGDAECARLLLERAYGKVLAADEFEPVTEIRVHIHKNVPMNIDQPWPSSKVVEGE